jgi:histidinol-phosphate aminotransferase
MSKRFWSDKAKSIMPYVPGEQPRDKILIKLNTNENPYPPSPKVMARIMECVNPDLRLYPDPESTALREAAARYYGVPSDRIFPGNGSDEVLAFLFQAFFNPDEMIAFPDITYSFYPVYCDLYSIPYVAVPLRDDFTIDFADYPEGLRAILFANPNAPTGLFIPPEKIEELLAARPDTLIVVDEAYVEFGGRSAVPLIDRYENLLIVNTMSKSHALAGMRIGLAIGNRSLIEALNAIKNSFNSYTMDRLAQAAAEAAFNDRDYYADTRARIIRTRERIKETLRRMGIPCTDSMANFIFIRIPGVAGPEAMGLFRKEGILVRNLKAERIKDWLRISIGADEDMDMVVRTIGKITGKPIE